MVSEGPSRGLGTDVKAELEEAGGGGGFEALLEVEGFVAGGGLEAGVGEAGEFGEFAEAGEEEETAEALTAEIGVDHAVDEFAIGGESAAAEGLAVVIEDVEVGRRGEGAAESGAGGVVGGGVGAEVHGG
jgi:hypothetical protein